jgi:MFS family permease
VSNGNKANRGTTKKCREGREEDMAQAMNLQGRAGLLGFTRYQWLVFFIVWLGWALDATDFNLFSLVLKPAVTEVLGGTPTPADIGKWGGLLAMVGLLGWALGGMFFGVIADSIGRVRTLVISIILVAVFTAAQGLSQNIVQFGICRFLSGVGTGAEIVVGIPLLAEAFADKAARAKVLGFMMTGGAFGSLIGGEIYNWFAPYGWRAVFYAGLMPAILLFLIRRNLDEPDYFKRLQIERTAIRQANAASDEDKAKLRVGMLQLFSRRHIYATSVGLLFCIGTLLSIWTSQIWLPTVQANMIKASGITGPAAIQSLGWGTKLWGIGGIFGYICFGYLADWFGRRPAICFYNIGAIASGLYLYLGLPNWDLYPYVLPVFGFFIFGVFSGHAIWLPELFPTYVRATSLSFCNGTGRIITSFGPLVAGLLAGAFGGDFNLACAVMTCFAVLSLLAVLLGRETRDEQLPK